MKFLLLCYALNALVTRSDGDCFGGSNRLVILPDPIYGIDHCGPVSHLPVEDQEKLKMNLSHNDEHQIEHVGCGSMSICSSNGASYGKCVKSLLFKLPYKSTDLKEYSDLDCPDALESTEKMKQHVCDRFFDDTIKMPFPSPQKRTFYPSGWCDLILKERFAGGTVYCDGTDSYWTEQTAKQGCEKTICHICGPIRVRQFVGKDLNYADSFKIGETLLA